MTATFHVPGVTVEILKPPLPLFVEILLDGSYTVIVALSVVTRPARVPVTVPAVFL